ncbi:MAG: GAF domain-containing protein [Spirochaetota bacterium]
MNQTENYLSYILDILQFEKEDEKEYLDYALAQCLKLTKSRFGYIYHYDENKKEFTLNTWSNEVMDECKVVNPQIKYQLEKTGIWGEVVRQRKEIIVNDFEKENPLKKGYPKGHIDIKNFLSVPIFEKDKIIAVIGVANKESDYDEDDLINLKLFVNIVFKELTRIKITKELKNEKNWSELIINRAPVIIIGLGKNSKIILFNRFAEELTGYQSDEVIGKNWIEIFIDKEDKETLYNEWNNLIKNKRNDNYLNYIITKNGNKRLINWNNIVLKDLNDNDFVLSIGMDITDLSESERKLQIHNKRLSTLLNIGTFLIQSNTIDEVFDKICLSISKLMEDISVAVYSLKDNILFLNSTLPTLPKDFPQDLKYASLKDHPHIKKAIDNKSYVYVEDFSKEKLTVEEEKITKIRNLKSVIYFPLYYEDHIFGVLIIGKQNLPSNFFEDEIDLFEVLTRFASIKIENLKTHFEKISYIEKLESLNKQQVELLKQLHQSEERFRRLFDNAQDIIYRYDFLPEPHFSYVNEATKMVVGYSPQEYYDDPRLAFKIIHPEDRHILESIVKGQVDKNKSLIIRWIHKNGEIIYTEHKNIPIYDENGKLIALEGIARDITERIKIEKEKEELKEQLIQSQKIESIGMLAGGIAHDYNNMLAIILGYAENLKERFNKDDPIQDDINEILKAAQTTKELTHQLLAFGRKQALAPKVLNLNQLIKSMEKMLRRTLREDIALKIILDENLVNIMVDPVQIQQIILNLVVNAKDAMPDGGNIIIETKNVELTNDYVKKHIGSIKGPHVMLAISDTGHGMDKETMEKIFDPFFSTKELGKGTGLGLATVYGIVKQSGGNIWVYSEVGKGTTLKFIFQWQITLFWKKLNQ